MRPYWKGLKIREASQITLNWMGGSPCTLIYTTSKSLGDLQLFLNSITQLSLQYVEFCEG